MTVDLKKAVSAHVASMIELAQNAGDGLAGIVEEARGDLLGPDWLAGLEEAFGPDASPGGQDSPQSLALRAQQIRTCPAVQETGAVIGLRLFNGSRLHVDRLQRDAYTRDQRERARIYDRNTGSHVTISASITDDELALLARLPLDGRNRDEWLLSLANGWRDGFTAAVVKSLAGTGGGFRRGVQALAASVAGAFDQWGRQVANVANIAALAAVNASAKEFALAFVPPESRPEWRVGSIGAMLARGSEAAA